MAPDSRVYKQSLVLLCLLLVATDARAAEVAPGAAVTAGREALKQHRDAPWYDAKTDVARRITLSPPPAPAAPSTPWNLNFNWVSYVIWTLMVVVLAVLVWLMIQAFINRERRLAQRHGSTVDVTGTHADRIEQLPIPVRRPAGDLLSEARYHYENGNYREAIVYLYSHELVELDKQQLIQLSRGKTNRQYLREIKSRQALRELMEQTVTTFEDAFFGHLDIGRQRFEFCWNRLSDFNAMLSGGPA
jgi:hypothetical protein